MEVLRKLHSAMKIGRIVIGIVLVSFNLAIIRDALGQPNLPTIVKGAVYRILTPMEGWSKEATSIMMKENDDYFLITNLHVLKTDSTHFVDSILIFLNRELDNGDVISGPKLRTIYLKRGGDYYFFKPSNQDIDLVLISVSLSNSTMTESDIVLTLRANALVGFETLRKRTVPNSIITLIGYPGKTKLLEERTPEYLWGDLLEISEQRVLTNIPVLKGSSGSPLFVRSKGKYYFLGIHSSHFEDKGITVAIPVNQISTCFQDYFNKTREKKSSGN